MLTRTQMTRRIALVATAISLALLAAVLWRGSIRPIGSASYVPFTVGIATWPGFGPGFIAQEQGFFGDLPVEFVILDDFSARQAAFSSGQTHATISTLDSFAYESAQGVRGSVVLILDESYGADAIVAKSHIRQADDLLGRTVAFTRGSPSHFFLMVYLDRHGSSLAAVETVEVDDPGRAGEAFVAGSVDAAVTWQPNVSRIVESGAGHVLDSTRLTPGLIVDAMVVAPEVVETRPTDVQRFVDGWLRAVTFVSLQPQTAYEIMSRGLGIPVTDLAEMVGGLRYADRDVNRRWLTDDGGAAAISLFDRAAALWQAAGIVEEAPRGADRMLAAFLSEE